MRIQPRVLVLNSNEDLLELLSEVLKAAGFEPRAVLIPDLERGRVDTRGLLRDFRPHAAIYDLALPYARNWDFLQRMKALPEAQGVAFVITTVNARASMYLTGPDVLELVLKPYDLSELTRRVADAVEASLGEREVDRDLHGA
jgi:DNA-binding response OmpR family regulator